MSIRERLKQVPGPVIIVAGVAALALLVLVLLGPILTGSAEVADPAAGAQAPLVEAGGTPEVNSFGDPASAPGPLPRDPFAPLLAPTTLASAGPPAPLPVPAPPAPAAPAAPAPAPAPIAAAAPVPAAAPAAPAPAPAVAPPPPPPPSAPPPPPPGPERVSLLEVRTDADGVIRATINVGEATYRAARLESFHNNNYRVEAIAGECVTLSKAGKFFRLCKGDVVIP